MAASQSGHVTSFPDPDTTPIKVAQPQGLSIALSRFAFIQSTPNYLIHSFIHNAHLPFPPGDWPVQRRLPSVCPTTSQELNQYLWRGKRETWGLALPRKLAQIPSDVSDLAEPGLTPRCGASHPDSDTALHLLKSLQNVALFGESRGVRGSRGWPAHRQPWRR